MQTEIWFWMGAWKGSQRTLGYISSTTYDVRSDRVSKRRNNNKLTA